MRAAIDEALRIIYSNNEFKSMDKVVVKRQKCGDNESILKDIMIELGNKFGYTSLFYISKYVSRGCNIKNISSTKFYNLFRAFIEMSISDTNISNAQINDNNNIIRSSNWLSRVTKDMRDSDFIKKLHLKYPVGYYEKLNNEVHRDIAKSYFMGYSDEFISKKFNIDNIRKEYKVIESEISNISDISEENVISSTLPGYIFKEFEKNDIMTREEIKKVYYSDKILLMNFGIKEICKIENYIIGGK